MPAAPRIQARIASNSRSLIWAWRSSGAGEIRLASAVAIFSLDCA
jgi:hypothetical protein